MRILTMPGGRRFPPEVTALTRPFWDALSEGRFTVTQCTSCQRMSFPPKPFCPHCWHREVNWTQLSGQGRLYSRTTIYFTPEAFAKDAPLQVGIVDLDENIRIACAVVGSEIPLDSRVELVTLQYEDGPLFGVVAVDSEPEPALNAPRDF
jgi:uncharacterized protein